VPADNHQTRSEICSGGRRGAVAALPEAAVLLRAEFCLLLRDFVEMVLTYGCNFGKLFEKGIVHRHH
jgi:hypothetical protein